MVKPIEGSPMRVLAVAVAGALVVGALGVVGLGWSGDGGGGSTSAGASASGSVSGSGASSVGGPTAQPAAPTTDSATTSTAPATPGRPAGAPVAATPPSSLRSTAAADPARSLSLSEGAVPAADPASTRTVDSCAQGVAPGLYSCFALRRVDAGAQPATGLFSAQITPSGLDPASLTAAYDLPSSTAGAGQTVYVVDAFDDPNAESDLGVYRAQFGLPVCTTANGCFKKVNQRGTSTPPAGDTGWAEEISLDLDMVSAVCPLCHITLVEADDNTANMMTAVRRANTMGAKFVSMSWGGGEDGSSTSYDTIDFAAAGVVYTAASGDYGYGSGHPIYPATSPRVVAVGGTSLTTSGNARGWAETAWAGAGSGCSADEPRPSWQNGATPCATRGTTDVSAVADPNTGVAVYDTYNQAGWDVYGGTSAATPIIASVFALAGRPNTTTTSAALLYRHPKAFHDITSGSNGSCGGKSYCTAIAGWDGPTGLGTPDGLTAFQLASHATRPGHTVHPGFPHPR